MLFLLGLSLEDKRYDETLAMLKTLHAYRKLGELTKAPDYAGFVQSPQHARWLLYLEEEAKEQNQK